MVMWVRSLLVAPLGFGGGPSDPEQGPELLDDCLINRLGTPQVFNFQVRLASSSRLGRSGAATGTVTPNMADSAFELLALDLSKLSAAAAACNASWRKLTHARWMLEQRPASCF